MKGEKTRKFPSLIRPYDLVIRTNELIWAWLLNRKLDLGKKFDDISKKMRNHFDDIRNVMQHPGEKGRSFEEVVREFLKKYFPKTLDISTGFLIDSNGNESNQMDIIISDAGWYCLHCIRQRI